MSLSAPPSGLEEHEIKKNEREDRVAMAINVFSQDDEIRWKYGSSRSDMTSSGDNYLPLIYIVKLGTIIN
jgi:hypothetical protein